MQEYVSTLWVRAYERRGHGLYDLGVGIVTQRESRDAITSACSQEPSCLVVTRLHVLPRFAFGQVQVRSRALNSHYPSPKEVGTTEL